ncbi:MAG: hypothetical protein ACFHHU_02490 [Porticoccaceae bacterium]
MVDNGFDPLGWMLNEAVAVDEAVTGLDLSNFEVRLYNTEGTNYEVVEIADFVDNGDGTYFISAPGDPRVDCILVSVLQVDGNEVELEIPASTSGSQAEPLAISYASTAATRQYINSVVESGGFNEDLSTDEVTELVQRVSRQVSSIVLPDDVDATDPNAVLAALESSASGLVRAQLELATAPPPESDLLAGIAGNYYTGFFGRFIFDNDDGAFGEDRLFFEDFIFAGDGTVFNPLPITVDEQNFTAEITLGSVTETEYGVVFEGAQGNLSTQPFAEVFASTESEAIPADILGDGTLMIDPGTGLVDEGYIFDNGVERYYFAEINNALKFELMPWGTSYVGSAFFRFDEYRLNDGSTGELNSTCLIALGIEASDLPDLTEEEFDDLIASRQDADPNLGASLVSDCEHNGTASEVLGVTMAKQPSGVSAASLAGDWGLVGIEAGFNPGAFRGIFSSMLTLGDGGSLDESGYTGFGAWFSGGTVNVEADTFAITGGTFSTSVDGIVDLNFEIDDTARGVVSSDLGLMYIGGADVDTELLEGESWSAFAVPLTTGLGEADLDGTSYEFVGLSFSMEGGLEAGTGRISMNQDANSGLTMDFAMDGEELVATLGGSTDLGLWDLDRSSFLPTNVNVTIEMNDPADGAFPVEVADNGQITIRIEGDAQDEESEDLLVKGFLDANGRLVMAIASGNVGLLDVYDTAVADEVEGFAESAGFDFVNFGYLMGTCVEGCSAE